MYLFSSLCFPYYFPGDFSPSLRHFLSSIILTSMSQILSATHPPPQLSAPALTAVPKPIQLFM